MNQTINEVMKILWSDFEENSVEDKLSAFEKLKDSATTNDLPQLIDLLNSERNGFWERELLSEPISELGGVKYLPELFDAAEKNRIEGHDNDGLNHFLTEIAEVDSVACKRKLHDMLNTHNFKHKGQAEWLLTFCES